MTAMTRTRRSLPMWRSTYIWLTGSIALVGMPTTIDTIRNVVKSGANAKAMKPAQPQEGEDDRRRPRPDAFRQHADRRHQDEPAGVRHGEPDADLDDAHARAAGE